MTIAEVGKRFDLTADTLRYYERVGLIPPVARTPGGVRDYNEAVCRWVGFAKCMRAAGVQVEALVAYVALFQQGEETQEARKQILVDQRRLLQEKLHEIQSSLSRLDEKIKRYEQLITPVEDHLQRRAGNAHGKDVSP